MKKIILIILVTLLFITGCGKKEEQKQPIDNNPNVKEEEKKEEVKKEVTIFDMKSNARPYAVVYNNTPVAIKVQTGMQEAYLVYEIPVEGSMSRILALFQNKTHEIGTIRSARHDFLDYALENDAIFIHWGYSHYAQNQIPKLGVNNINGLSDSGFYRNNPEKLATEHTGYTTLAKMKITAEKKKYRTTTDVKPPVNIVAEEVNLNEKANNIVANTVEIPYGSFTAKFVYDAESKLYKRYAKGKENIDYATKKQYTAKNIIVTKITYQMADDNYYWDLNNTGKGSGYYITNGYAVPITWQKDSRSSKTIYKYEDGTEISVNDGLTWIALQTTKKTLSIN